jgi:MFS family permease
MTTVALPHAGVATTAPAPHRHPLRQRDFLVWWAGATVSLAGDQFYVVALPWIVLQLTGSGIAMGTVAMAAGVPRAILMLMGGAVSDRSSPRRVLMATAAARTVFVAAIGVLLWRGHLVLWHLYLLATAFGIADAFALPSSSALMRTLVPIEQLPAANSVWQTSALLASIVGPAPAGLIMKALGAAWAFLLDAFSFLFILAALWRLPDPSPTLPAGAKPGVWNSIGEGLRYVGGDVPLRTLMLVTAVLNFCLAGPLSVGLAYLAKARFSSPAAFGGWISSVAGGTLAGVLLAGVVKTKRRGLLLVFTGIVLGIATSALGFLPGFWAVAALLGIMGCFNGFLNVQFQAWFQQRVDRAVLGRVTSVIMLSAFGLMPLSMAATGVAVEWNARLTFLLAGGAVIVVSGFGALQKPVRDLT